MARKPITDVSAWPSLTLEGNLIAPAMVASIDRRQASEQTEEDYRIRKGLTIREEISTAFRVGQSHFDGFAKFEKPSVEATRRFVRDFLKETFGFDDLSPADGVVSFLAGGRVPSSSCRLPTKSSIGAARRFPPTVRAHRLSRFRTISTTATTRCGAW